MAFQKALRVCVWLKIGMTGTSGSGKTFSALRVATGLARKQNSRIAFISTEKTRTLYYASQFDYDVLELDDYSTESYINAIEEAIAAGYQIIIIDSLSHGWQYLNDTHSKMGGNSFQNWGKLKPKWQKLMQEILACPAHVFVLSRAKTEWSIEDKNGKSTPTKVGLGTEGDKQQDYEYTVSFVIQQGTHVASVNDGGKDNTGLYDSRYEVLTEKDGERLYDWANSSSIPAKTMADPMLNKPDNSAEELAELQDTIIKACVAHGGQKNAELMATLAQFNAKNPKNLKDIETAKKCLDAVNALQ